VAQTIFIDGEASMLSFSRYEKVARSAG